VIHHQVHDQPHMPVVHSFQQTIIPPFVVFRLNAVFIPGTGGQQ